MLFRYSELCETLFDDVDVVKLKSPQDSNYWKLESKEFLIVITFFHFQYIERSN